MRNTFFKLYLLLLFIAKAGISFSQHRLPCRVESPYVSNWKLLGPFTTDSTIQDQHFGMITAISVNPRNKNEIYVAGSSSSLFVTKNRGKTWECLTDHAEFPVVGIKHIFVNYLASPRKIMCFTGETFQWYDPANFGIIRSHDGGQTWTRMYEEAKGVFNVFAFHGFVQDSLHDIMYAYGSKTIVRSSDGGSSWHPIFSVEKMQGLAQAADFNIKDIALNKEKDELFISLVTYPIRKNNQQLWESKVIGLTHCDALATTMKTIDYTELFTKAYIHPDPEGIWNIRLHKSFANSDTLYVNAQFAKTMSQVIYLFNTSTHSIDKFVIPNQGNMKEDLGWKAGLRVNPYRPEEMYMAGNVLHRSNDSGKTFHALYAYGFGDATVPHADIRTYVMNWSDKELKSEIYLGTDGGLSYSSDGGTCFTNLNGTQLPLTQFYGLDVSPFTSIISAGSQDNSIFSYQPQQKKWIYDCHGDGYDVEYSKRYPLVGYGQYNYRIPFKTKNDLAPFNEMISSEAFDIALQRKTLQAYPNGDLYFAEKNFHIYHPQKDVWEKYPLPTPHQALAFQVAPSDSSVVYLSSLWSGLYTSNDGGKTFQDITSSIYCNGYYLGGSRFHAICVHPDDPKRIWIGLGYLGDYYDLCRQSIRIIYSSDGGKTWQDYSEGLPIYSVSDIVFLEGTKQALFAATLEGIYFREDSSSAWKLYSTHFPKCVVPELKVDYCRGKLVAATYGRGLWETDLPACNYNAPRILYGSNHWKLSEKDAAIPVTTDIDLGRKASLTISSPVYMAKNKCIYYKGKLKNRVRFEGNGTIINGCGEVWGGIKKRK